MGASPPRSRGGARRCGSPSPPRTPRSAAAAARPPTPPSPPPPPPPPPAAERPTQRPLRAPPLPASAQASDAPTVSPLAVGDDHAARNRSPISPNPDEEKRRAPESPARRADVDERATPSSPLRVPPRSRRSPCSNLAALAPPAGCELESAVDGVGDQFILDVFKNMVGSALDADHLETLLA